MPQVIGQTAEAQSRKSGGPRPKRQWDEESFFSTLAQEGGEAALEGGRRVYRWAQHNAERITWGEGVRYGTCLPDFGDLRYPLAIWTNGLVEVRFQYLARTPQFADAGRRRELLERLNQIPGVSIPSDAYDRMPNIPLAPLASDEGWGTFEQAMSWMVGRRRTETQAHELETETPVG